MRAGVNNVLDRRRFMGPVDTGPPIGVNLVDYDSADWIDGKYISGQNDLQSEITTATSSNNIITPILPYDSKYEYAITGFSTASNRKYAIYLDAGSAYGGAIFVTTVLQSEGLESMETFNETLQETDAALKPSFPDAKLIGVQFSCLKSAYTNQTISWTRTA